MRGLDRDVIPFLEECGRTCYKSEDLITPMSASKFVSGIVKSKHESVIEHASITVRIVGSRSMTHQLVRHRIASYSQESQRFVNYSKDKHGSEIVFIDPMFKVEGKRYTYEQYEKLFDHYSGNNEDAPQEFMHMFKAYTHFEENCRMVENEYMEIVEECFVNPEDARELLPNSCKTEIVITANLRVWRHIFAERAVNNKAQFQIRYLTQGILKEFNAVLPEIFGDIVDTIDKNNGWVV